MSFGKFYIFEATKIGKLKKYGGNYEASFTTSKDREVVIDFTQSYEQGTTVWDILFDVEGTQQRVQDVGDHQEILQGILAYVDQFFKMKIKKKDVVRFSGQGFRAEPYEKMAKTLLWKRSGADGLYISKRVSKVIIYFIYTDKGHEFVQNLPKSPIKVK